MLLVPACTLSDPRPMGEGKHVRFTVTAGGARARAVAFGAGARLPVEPAERGGAPPPADATFRLEINRWQGAVEPRLVLGSARPSDPAPIAVLGEDGPYLERAFAAATAGPAPWPPPVPAGARETVDRRGRGLAGTIAALVASGEPVLVVVADVPRRLVGLQGRLGGFALCAYAALEADPGLAEPYRHVVALDPPAHAHRDSLLRAGAAGFAHVAWGEPELRFVAMIQEMEHGLRAPLAAVYRGLRDAGGAQGDALAALLRGDGAHGRSPALAGRLLRVLSELSLVHLDQDRMAARVLAAARTDLEQSATYRDSQRRYEDGQRYLTRATVALAA